MLRRHTCCAALVLGLGMCNVLAAEDWPQWRGPRGDGIAQATNLPTKWTETENVLWKLDLPGMAGSTPIAWGDKLFLTSAEGDSVVLLCLSKEGKQHWKKTLTQSNRRFRVDEGDFASPTPSTDGTHVFTFTGAGDFACHDFEGKEVWKFNAQERYGRFRIQHGMHITPLLHGDRLYLSLLHSGGWWVLAFDKANGKEVWKVKRDTDARAECEQAYASPILGRNGAEEFLIVHGCDYTTAHRLADGSEIWRLGDLNPQGPTYHRTLRFVATPVAVDGLIVVPTAKNNQVVALKTDGKGLLKAGNPAELWRKQRITPDVPSPLVHDGLLYLCKENGLLLCLDAKTGNLHYQERLHPARYRASPVFADGKIYCCSRDGRVSVVKAGPKFELLGMNVMADEIAASPMIAHGRLYIRTYSALYALGTEASATK